MSTDHTAGLYYYYYYYHYYYYYYYYQYYGYLLLLTTYYYYYYYYYFQVSTDHTAGLYLLLIGRVAVSLGSPTVTITHIESHEGVAASLRPGDRVQLEGSIYTVTAVDGSSYATLDRCWR